MNSFLNSNDFAVVSPQWTGAQLTSNELFIIDTRSNVYDYFAGHIPGSVHLADATLRAPLNGIPVQYLDPSHLQAIFRRAGLNQNDKVLLYGEGDTVLSATMIAYILKKLGHQGQILVLNGGFKAYKEQGLPIDQKYPTAKKGNFTANVDEDLYVDLEEVRRSLTKGDTVFLDARPHKTYRGQDSIWMRNGHIPGAVNLEWKRLTRPEDNHIFKSLSEIKEIFSSYNLRHDQKIIVYCGTSREATLLFHLMRYVLGYGKARLYEGSWTEYSSHSDLPVETE